MPVLDTLIYWRDKHARTGFENMAVDQLLLERLGDHPVLRVYHWSEPTVSFGYFLALKDAQSAFPSSGSCPLTYVRRWTGGGIVDHRIDVTYTLAIPRGHALSAARGAESYRVIHQALESTLKQLHEPVRLTAVDGGDGGLACFTNPVAYDLINHQGEKIAGAGQRRTRYGLLHQGSLITQVEPDALGRGLAQCLARQTDDFLPDPSFDEDTKVLASERYASDAWLAQK
ncbi:MAG: hypothetical protein H7A51_00505 [Akkermansiaceae bacterium]|nr:hypothetical protein [Akkermansiaceae bacterium]